MMKEEMGTEEEEDQKLLSGSTESDRKWRHPYLIEPAMVLYMLTRWTIPIASTQFLKERLKGRLFSGLERATCPPGGL